MLRLLAATTMLAMFLAGPSHARAELLHYDFSSVNGTLGHSQAFISHGVTVTAYGFSTGGSSLNLFGHDTGNERGLGIAGTAGGPNHQITTQNFVQVDLGNVYAQTTVTSQMIHVGIGREESYKIYGSNTLGSLGTLIGTDNNGQFTLPANFSFNYLSVTGSTGDVTFRDLDVHEVRPTPEPASVVLFGIGGTALLWFGLRRTRNPGALPLAAS